MGKIDLFNSGNPLHIYIIARWFYKCGQELINDTVYTKMEDVIKVTNPDSVYLKRHWQDDPEPTELLSFYDLDCCIDEDVSDRVKSYRDKLLYNKSYSISPIRSYEDAYEWFKTVEGYNLIFMLKIDGINVKVLFDRTTGEILVASSRARKDNGLLDYTESVSKKLNGRVKLDISKLHDNIGVCYCEGYVDFKGLTVLRDYYPTKDFKSPRSAGLSVLRVPVEDELMKYFHLCLFKVDDYGRKLSECLDDLDNRGFETPAYITDRFVDTGFDDFKAWVDSILKPLDEYRVANGIPCDGVVVEIDNQVDFRNQSSTETYSSGNAALKFGPWEAQCYTSVVKGIVVESSSKSKENKGVKLLIEPTMLSNYNVVDFVDGSNLRKIINRGIVPGSVIEFVYESDSNCVLK